MKFASLSTLFCSVFITAGYSQIQNITLNSAAGDSPHIALFNSDATGWTHDPRAGIWLDNSGQLKFRSVTGNGFAFRNTPNLSDLVIITDNGMGINTNSIPYGFQLAINGNTIANSVTVKLRDNWPDYVFNRKYQVMALPALKTYLGQNHHLPDVPTEKEVAEKGIDLGEMNKLLLKKVEELTLYLIEKDAEVKAQGLRISRLEKLTKKNN